MTEEITLATTGDVGIYCLPYSNPSSINGPFGNMKLVVFSDGSAT